MSKLTESYNHGVDSTPLLEKTIGLVLQETAEKSPDKEAVVFCAEGIRKTFSQLLKETDALAAGLLALGFQPGDRLAVWSPNRYEWVLTQYATAKVGIILVAVSPMFGPEELKYALNKVQPQGIVIAPTSPKKDFHKVLMSVVKSETGSPDSLSQLKIISMGEETEGDVLKFWDVTKKGGEQEVERLKQLQQTLQPDQPIHIAFTSGTTGPPKAPVFSHRHVINNCYFTGRRLNYHEEDHRLCVPMPIWRALGMIVCNLNPLVFGHTAVYSGPDFNPIAVLAAIDKERCTSVYGNSPMLMALVKQPTFGDYDISSLRTATIGGQGIGGSDLPLPMLQMFRQKLHLINVTVAMPMTECGPVAFQSILGDPDEKLTSTVGCPHPHVEVKVVDDAGCTVPVNTPGQFLTRGYYTMLQYWGDQGKTDQAFTADGWFQTGDIISMNEDGYVQLLGRESERIKVGDTYIFPKELENVLRSHKQIKDGQIVEVSVSGETKLCACVVLESAASLTETDILDFCKDKLPAVKVPQFVCFFDTFPLTPTKKVKKSEVKLEAERRLNLS
ncbi:medium-chain acyl-CoA ligase ACSF2, mitochondrial-like [Branchiostoma floridae x Branchiostoma belcheri]